MSGQDAPDRISLAVPRWLRQLGYASWLLIGIAIVLIGVSAALSAMRGIVVPTLFAILLAATFLPVVDRLERWRLKRWVGAVLVTLLIIAGSAVLVLIVVKGLLEQAPAIAAQIDAALSWIQAWLSSHNIDPGVVGSVESAIKNGASSLARGAVGGVVHGMASVASLVFGIFIAFNILIYLLISGRRIGAWLSGVVKPVPQAIAYSILSDSARFLRGYLWGSTLVGVFNGLVAGVGAAIIDVPLAATIGIVCWASNYIPMFGALIGGAFAVLIALGVGGFEKAALMLVFIIIANGPLQNVVMQFALGGTLKLHGLVVLFATTAGAIVGGAIGGVFAAPFTKIGLDAYRRLRDAGMFDEATPEATAERLADEGRRSDASPAITDAPPPSLME